MRNLVKPEVLEAKPEVLQIWKYHHRLPHPQKHKHTKFQVNPSRTLRTRWERRFNIVMRVKANTRARTYIKELTVRDIIRVLARAQHLVPQIWKCHHRLPRPRKPIYTNFHAITWENRLNRKCYRLNRKSYKFENITIVFPTPKNIHIPSFKSIHQ